MPRTEAVYQQIRQEQRQKILNAAKVVFAKRGRSATMADVASEAGVSQGLAYRYFASKNEILASLVKDTMESAGAYNEIIKKLPGTPAERLDQIITRLLELRRERPGYYQLVYQLIGDEETPEDLREMVTRQGKVLQKEMRKLIVEGQASGEIAEDNPDHLLEAIMACIEGLWRRMTFSDPEISGENLPDPKIILRMLRPDQKVRKK